MTRTTVLHETHRALGATFTDFAGWSMPVRYDSAIAEHHAVRSTAGLFDLTHMGELEITGAQAAEALDYALVGQPTKIGVGRARYTMLCQEDGGIIDDLVVYRLAEEHFLIVANASNVAVVGEELAARLAGFEAELADRSEDWVLLAVQGPATVAILDPLTDLAVDDLRYYAISSGTLKGSDVLLARTGYTGEDGFEIYCQPQDAMMLWDTLLSAGRERGLVPAGLACRDTLRLEAGMPLYGQELSRSLTPFEAGLGRIVSPDKHADYVGRDALERRRGEEPSQTLVGLASQGRRSPRTGYAVLDEAGNQIGEVTSGAPSPTLGHPIAMAYVAPEHQAPGTRLVVDLRGNREPVDVVELPFYRRPS